MADIFISYSRSDHDFARRLYSELQRFNVRGFMDRTDIIIGASWSRQLREAIESSDAIVVILSKDATQSSWVMAEVGLAQSLGKQVIPVLAPRQNYDESVPPQLLDRFVVEADRFPIEEVAARVVAAATGTSIEAALGEVRSRARRRQRLLVALAATLAFLTVVSLSTAFFAVKQRQEAEAARGEAEARRERIEQLTGLSASLAISPDGKILAVGNRDGHIELWKLSSGERVADLRWNSRAISSLAYSPDGQLLASASWDGDLQLWDLATGRQLMLFTGHSDAVVGVQFAPDGRALYSRSLDGTIREWNLQTGAEIRAFRGP